MEADSDATSRQQEGLPTRWRLLPSVTFVEGKILILDALILFHKPSFILILVHIFLHPISYSALSTHSHLIFVNIFLKPALLDIAPGNHISLILGLIITLVFLKPLVFFILLVFLMPLVFIINLVFLKLLVSLIPLVFQDFWT